MDNIHISVHNKTYTVCNNNVFEPWPLRASVSHNPHLKIQQPVIWPLVFQMAWNENVCVGKFNVSVIKPRVSISFMINLFLSVSSRHLLLQCKDADRFCTWQTAWSFPHERQSHRLPATNYMKKQPASVNIYIYQKLIAWYFSECVSNFWLHAAQLRK